MRNSVYLPERCMCGADDCQRCHPPVRVRYTKLRGDPDEGEDYEQKEGDDE